MNTRQRLLDAAIVVFAREGFGSTTVQQVCAEADFTRGAFYSNFSSLTELYLEAWKQESVRLIERFRTAETAAIRPETTALDDAVAVIDSLVPVDQTWFQVSTEFTALATRRHELLPLLEEREAAVRAGLAPIIGRVVTHFGLEATDLEEFCRALVAVHDGTVIQLMTESDVAAARRRRVILLTATVKAFTREA